MILLSSLVLEVFARSMTMIFVTNTPFHVFDFHPGGNIVSAIELLHLVVTRLRLHWYISSMKCRDFWYLQVTWILCMVLNYRDPITTKKLNALFSLRWHKIRTMVPCLLTNACVRLGWFLGDTLNLLLSSRIFHIQVFGKKFDFRVIEFEIIFAWIVV